MANERLYQFPAKTSPVPADIIYAGDSADAFNEINITIAQLISAYPNLFGIAALTLGNNTYAYVNNSGTWTAGSITSFGVALLASNITPSANELLYATGATSFGLISAAANSILATNGSNAPSLTQTLPSAVQSNITQLGAQAAALNMNSNAINNVTDPTNAQDAATKNYVDNHAQGFNPIPGVAAATTANLNATYNNGSSGVGATLTNAGVQVAFTLDGYSASLNDRILVKNQSTTYQNGVYSVTTVGNGSTNWVLTRTTDYDTPSQIQVGDLTIVENGTANVGTSWIQTSTVTTIGSSAITFTNYFNPNSFLKVSNNLSDLASIATALANIHSPITQINVQTFTSGGTYTPTSGMVYCIAKVQAAGGGGGGVVSTGSSQNCIASSGGAGAYSEGILTAVQIGASQTITIGSAGTAGANTGGNGGNGGSSSIGTLIVCAGGTGGTGNTSATAGFINGGGAGGTVTTAGNIIALNGKQGMTGFGVQGAGVNAAGANSVLGFGGVTYGATGTGSFATSSSNLNASGYGAGGAGALSCNGGGNSNGGVGGGGIAIIIEFISA